MPTSYQLTGTLSPYADKGGPSDPSFKTARPLTAAAAGILIAADCDRVHAGDPCAPSIPVMRDWAYSYPCLRFTVNPAYMHCGICRTTTHVMKD